MLTTILDLPHLQTDKTKTKNYETNNPNKTNKPKNLFFTPKEEKKCGALALYQQHVNYHTLYSTSSHQNNQIKPSRSKSKSIVRSE